jgi:preprotein translocase subunit SecF
MKIRYSKYRKIYYLIAVVLGGVSIFCLVKFGLKPSIDFAGGSIIEIEYKADRPSNQDIEAKLAEFNLGDFSIQPSGDKGIILKTKEIDESLHSKILTKLRDGGVEADEKIFQAIGPSIGNELRQKTMIVILLALLVMIIYIAIAFSKVQRPLHSWQYGIASVIALFHDVLIPLGAFSLLGHYYGTEISIPVIAALLTVLGYSINNTVVVFDRIRENLFKRSESFEEVVDRSLAETLTRQVNSSLTVLFSCGAIFFFGGETLKDFSLILIIGVTAGLFSSFFLAGPILVTWLNLSQRKNKVETKNRAKN